MCCTQAGNKRRDLVKTVNDMCMPHGVYRGECSWRDVVIGGWGMRKYESDQFENF